MALRTRVDLLFGHNFVLRGESRRNAEFADLSLIEHPSTEGSTACYSVCLTLSNGKANKYAKQQFGAAMRHADPYLCTMGGLSGYLFYRWHILKEPPPNLRTRKQWYHTKVLLGSEPTEPMSYQVQYDDIKQVFGEVGVNSDSITHAPRKSAVQMAEFHGVAESQVRTHPSLTLSYEYNNPTLRSAELAIGQPALWFLRT